MPSLSRSPLMPPACPESGTSVSAEKDRRVSLSTVMRCQCGSSRVTPDFVVHTHRSSTRLGTDLRTHAWQTPLYTAFSVPFLVTPHVVAIYYTVKAALRPVR